MTFMVTLTCDSTLLLTILAFLSQFEYMFTIAITKRSILIRLEAWMFCIGSNGRVPDEYQRDENKKNWFHPDLTIPVWIPPANLLNSGFTTFREIDRKPLHINSERTVVFIPQGCGCCHLFSSCTLLKAHMTMHYVVYKTIGQVLYLASNQM